MSLTGCLRHAGIRAGCHRRTNFVLLHGGWPYHEVAQAMTDEPSTCVVSWHPEKVLFGSDAYSDVGSPLRDWEEKEWLMTWKARRAPAIALTAMARNGEVTRPRAAEIAHWVLRGKAARLYALGPDSK